jgi:ATP-dependent helicase HrpA
MSAESVANEELSLNDLYQQLSSVRLADIALIKKRLSGVKKIQSKAKQQKILLELQRKIQQSAELKQLKQQRLPNIIFPEALPVSQHVEQISRAIAENQVVIIAGETGSGKTTQIPKICMALGRGVEGMIGHTQPRRIAARTVAARIAEELDTEVGDLIGYKVRFTDQVSEHSFVKLMTDGILLAEMQKDRLLRQYDTLIIDEAHERSLNIDFLLGYIKQILPKRPDLKVIITSATIDPQRFSQHFNQAPMFEVSGRTYPVDVWYRPLEDYAQGDVIQGIINAVEELCAYDQGDILVFLNGEREIRDTAYALEKCHFPHTHILPLFSRLTVQEQNRIFAPHTGRNIVLATNVAETSLTVPGIKFVIDTGTARISRYSYRTKVQRLPIEPISQASANQRAGRCGRVSAGVCIRLYSEEDFLSRPEFTDPEILRTNLATVILQMLALDLGDISDFPFVEPPDNRHINDGMRLLEELAAITWHNQRAKLTTVGQQLARFPIDPRLSKMVLTALDLNCSHDVMAIVSALSIQDPRERPLDKQQAADQAHGQFTDKKSDFVSLLNLWHYVLDQQKHLSNNQFRKLCQQQFLSYLRIREWQDIYSQLKQTVNELKPNQPRLIYHKIVDDQQQQQHLVNVHQAILSGLLSHIGHLDENREYKGTRNSRFVIFPGSGLAKKPPKWIMAAELVETSRLFARHVSAIEQQWIEPLAKHLIKKQYLEPHWSKKNGCAMAYEQVSLYGLIIVAKRLVNFKQIDKKLARELFIRHGLVEGDVQLNDDFFKHNQALINDIEQLEQKARRKNFLVDDETLYAFYDQRIPEEVICLASFKKWWKKQQQRQPDWLKFDKDFLLNEDDQHINAQNYPETWRTGEFILPLSYHFAPGEPDDGVSVHIPLAILNQIQPIGFDYLIPALRLELITAYIKGLPKNLRKNFVPAPNYASACLSRINEQIDFSVPLIQQLSKHLLKMTGVTIAEEQWQQVELPAHLQMNFKIEDDNGKVIAQGRNLFELQQSMQGKVKATLSKVADKGIERQEVKQWDFGRLPKEFVKRQGNIEIKAYPALIDKGQSVAVELLDNAEKAQEHSIAGVCRLILLTIPSPIKYLQQHLPNKAKLGLYFNPFGSINELLDDCIFAACRYLVQQQPMPETETDFNQLRDKVRAELADVVLQSALKLEKTLTLAHDINKRLKGNTPLNLIQAYGDIKDQLNQLIFKGFVSYFGVDKLADIARYLQAIIKRFEKLAIDSQQDKLKQLTIERIEQKIAETLAKKPELVNDLSLKLHFMLMVQELRVSLFAQQLGTAYPISVKRIEQALNELTS